MKILIYDLPEKEVAYIKRNCVNEIENKVLTLYDGTENPLTEAQEQNLLPDIVISQSTIILQQATALGVTAIAYQTAFSKADILVEGFEEVDMQFFTRIWQRRHHLPWTILETKRLLVRELTLEDLDALFELYSYEGMTDYMEGLYPYEEEYAYQKAYIESMYGFFGYGMWLVFEKESGKLVGRAGVEHREELDGELELGYAIGTPWQGIGFATEVCEGILRYVQEELYFEEIVSLVEPANIASVHLLEKLGFSLERNWICLEYTIKNTKKVSTHCKINVSY